ncbi:S1 family peptidase [Mycobacterium sp. SVM_VP21]|nr:S1 family peptidase [Mycobacterium sp. SVM_VP21]
MEIRQDTHVCTLGYVDPVLRVAFTAGHCRGSGIVTDRGGTVIGRLATFRDNTPNGSTVNTDQVIADYEAIELADDVDVNDVLPDGRHLQAGSDDGLEPGEPVCHFGIVTGETCGTVERVNNGWFTMSRSVRSQQGDSGGPVYALRDGGSARIVGLFNSMWGDYPAAVSWPAISQQVREDVGVPTPLS